MIFAEKALQPAKVSRVTVVDGGEKHLEVIVDDSQLSLAIGKKGQNVRLAAKLLGWKIDIKSEEEKRQEVEQQMRGIWSPTATPLEQVPELGEGIIEKLVAAGITTVEALADMTPEQLEEIPGIGPKTVEKISIAVNNYFSSLEAGEAAARRRGRRSPLARRTRRGTPLAPVEAERWRRMRRGCRQAEAERVKTRCRSLSDGEQGTEAMYAERRSKNAADEDELK